MTNFNYNATINNATLAIKALSYKQLQALVKACRDDSLLNYATIKANAKKTAFIEFFMQMILTIDNGLDEADSVTRSIASDQLTSLYNHMTTVNGGPFSWDEDERIISAVYLSDDDNSNNGDGNAIAITSESAPDSLDDDDFVPPCELVEEEPEPVSEPILSFLTDPEPAIEGDYDSQTRNFMSDSNHWQDLAVILLAVAMFLYIAVAATASVVREIFKVIWFTMRKNMGHPCEPWQPDYVAEYLFT